MVLELGASDASQGKNLNAYSERRPPRSQAGQLNSLRLETFAELHPLVEMWVGLLTSL